MTDRIEPLPYDPSAFEIQSMIDLHAGEPWYLTNEGEYGSFVVATMKADGTNQQILIAIQWPTRINNTNEKHMIQMLIHPDDAAGLAEILTNTLAWLDAARRMSG